MATDPFLLAFGSSASLTDRGFEHYDAEEYRAALRFFARALSRKPVDRGAFIGGVASAIRLGKAKEVVPLLRDYISWRPNDHQGQLWLGLAYLDLSRFSEAVEPLRNAVALDPGDPMSQANLGTALGNLERYDDALPYLVEAARLAPENASMLSDLGSCLCHLHRFEEAEAHLRKALAIAPDSARVLSDLGGVLLETDRWPEAEEIYERALRAIPDDVEAHQPAVINLGVIMARRGRWPEALERYMEARRRWPDHGPSLAYSGEALVALNRMAEAREAFERAEALEPGFIGRDADLDAARVKALSGRTEPERHTTPEDTESVDRETPL